MYALVTMFAALALYAYWRNCQRLLIIAGIGTVLTHYFGAIIIVVMILHHDPLARTPQRTTRIPDRPRHHRCLLAALVHLCHRSHPPGPRIRQFPTHLHLPTHGHPIRCEPIDPYRQPSARHVAHQRCFLCWHSADMAGGAPRRQPHPGRLLVAAGCDFSRSAAIFPLPRQLPLGTLLRHLRIRCLR